MITSRYSFTMLLVIFLSTAFLLAFASIIFFDFYNTRNSGSLYAGIVFLLVIIVPLLFFSTTPRISFTDSSVMINYYYRKKVYDWKSVTKVCLSTKKLLMGRLEEAATVTFDDGYELKIWEKMYGNITEIRSFLQQKMSDKIEDPKTVFKAANLQLIGSKKYAGNPFFTFGAIVIGTVIIFFTVFILNHPDYKGPIYPAPIFILVIFLLLGRDMNYFIIDQDTLIIKNQFFPWIANKIALNNIKEIAIERPYRRSTSLRIITKDLDSKLCGGASLKQDDWDDLVGDFKLIGIPLQNDNID